MKTIQGKFQDLLNTLLSKDPENTEKLLACRVKFNQSVLDNIPVPQHPDGIGILGLVNSIVGYPVLAAKLNKETGKVEEFILVGKEDL